MCIDCWMQALARQIEKGDRMDIQTSWLECLSLIKDWSTLFIAAFGVWVAWQGLRTWRRQLKGTSQFDVAKRLMLKVYQIRQDISHCRSPYREIPIITHYEDGKPIPKSRQDFYSSSKEMKGRFEYIIKTFNEIEFLLFEAEVILDKEIREIFKPISEVCHLLRCSIEEYIEEFNPENDTWRHDKEERNRYRELRQIIFSRKNDDIEKKVNASVSEIEKFIKPYVHG